MGSIDPNKTTIGLFTAPNGDTYFVDTLGRKLSTKLLQALRADGVEGTTAQVFYQYAR